jgi:hypothetical protein
MGQQNMLDAAHVIKGQITNACSGVQQQVVVDQEGRGPAISGNGAGATQYTNLHQASLLIGSRN